jgi:hypothetical protein
MKLGMESGPGLPCGHDGRELPMATALGAGSLGAGATGRSVRGVKLRWKGPGVPRPRAGGF